MIINTLCDDCLFFYSIFVHFNLLYDMIPWYFPVSSFPSIWISTPPVTQLKISFVLRKRVKPSKPSPRFTYTIVYVSMSLLFHTCIREVQRIMFRTLLRPLDLSWRIFSFKTDGFVCYDNIRSQNRGYQDKMTRQTV